MAPADPEGHFWGPDSYCIWSPILPFWNLQLHASMIMRYRNLIPSGLNKSLSNIVTIYFLKFYFYASRIIVNSLGQPTAWYWYICFYKWLFNDFNKTLLNISMSPKHKSEVPIGTLMEAGFQTQIHWATSLLPSGCVVVGCCAFPGVGGKRKHYTGCEVKSSHKILNQGIKN